jgi:hypothetical protein
MNPEPIWARYKDEELLALRICDLGVRIEGSEIEPQVAAFYQLLERRGIAMRPACYLGDEWFSPTGVPAIAIPFFLAHPRLKDLEMAQMMDVEGGDPDEFQMLLRHECGHAIDHAYKLTERPERAAVFGSSDADYDVETYFPRPYSKSFVQHLPNWYAQAHPDEDFAETFAVWLADDPETWRARYKDTKALKKLEYVDHLMHEVKAASPLVKDGQRWSNAAKLRKTLSRYYAERRKLFAEDFPDFHDSDLHAIFARAASAGEPGNETAAKMMRRHKADLIASLDRWTGQRKYMVNMLVNKLIKRCQTLKLRAPKDSTHLLLDLTAYLAGMLTNHLYTGKFKRSV